MSPTKRSPEATQALRSELIEVALRLVARDGPESLTMRSLAAEAGCAVGLPYKVFTDRTELIAAVIAAEFARLRAAFDEIVAAAGTRTVAANLTRWAGLLLDSPAIVLAHEADTDRDLMKAIEVAAGESGVVKAIESTVVAYLGEEKRIGRVDQRVDERAFGFLIAGAVHNLLASGDAYPRPSGAQLARMLRSISLVLAPV